MVQTIDANKTTRSAWIAKQNNEVGEKRRDERKHITGNVVCYKEIYKKQTNKTRSTIKSIPTI